MTPPDYYEILQVSPTAEPAVIRTAYKRLAFQYHPDRNSDPSAERTMRLLNEAYAVLSDPARRQAYDAARQSERTRDQWPAPEWGSHGCLTRASVLGLLGLLACLNFTVGLARVAATCHRPEDHHARSITEARSRLGIPSDLGRRRRPDRPITGRGRPIDTPVLHLETPWLARNRHPTRSAGAGGWVRRAKMPDEWP